MSDTLSQMSDQGSSSPAERGVSHESTNEPVRINGFLRRAGICPAGAVRPKSADITGTETGEVIRRTGSREFRILKSFFNVIQEAATCQ